MVSVVVVRPASQLGIDGGASVPGVGLGFQQQRAAAFSDDKAVSLDVKGAGGVQRVGIAAGQGLGLGQGLNDQRAQNRFRANGQNGVRFP